MRRVLIRAGIVAASLLAPFALQRAAGAGAGASASALPARVIVKFRASSPVLRMQAQSALSQHAVQAQALGQRIGIALTAGRAISERSQVVFASGMTSRQLAARIGAESDIEYAVADEKKYIVAAPNDPFYATRAITASAGGPAVGQWYLKPPGPAGSGTVAGTAPAAINAEQAWDITTGSASDRRRRPRHRHPLRPSRPAGQRHSRLRHGEPRRRRLGDQLFLCQRRQCARQRRLRPGRRHHPGRQEQPGVLGRRLRASATAAGTAPRPPA